MTNRANKKSWRSRARKLLPATAAVGLSAFLSVRSPAGEPLVWRNDAPAWKPVTPADVALTTWKPVATPPASQPAMLDVPRAASLDLPRKPEATEHPDPSERIGGYLPPVASPDEPAPFPGPASPGEPVVGEPDGQTGNRAVNWTEQVEPLDVAPREVIAVEQINDPAGTGSQEMILPQGIDGSPAPLVEGGEGDGAVGLEKPRPFGHRVKRLINRAADWDPDGSKIFHGQLFEMMGVQKPTLTWRDELLLWRMNNDRVPALGTTGTTASGGIIGQQGTQPLFGPGPIDLQDRIGERSRASLYFPDHNWGIDGSFMFLGPRSSTFTYGSNAFPVISRPVYVLNPPPGEFVETVAFPGFSAGTLSIQANTRFWSSDVNFFKRVCCEDRTLDIFVGYRYVYFAESLQITENIIAQPGAPDPAGTYTVVADRFGTRNLFNGGQIGAQYGQRYGRFALDMRASVALGVNQQSVDIQGYQARLRPGEPVEVFSGGLLAAQSNIGYYNRRRFSVVPDLSLNVGYQVTDTLRAYVGYSFMYWSNVVRPGGQIDRVVDLNYIPNTPPAPPSGQRRPGVLFGESDLFLHGVNLGLEWMW